MTHVFQQNSTIHRAAIVVVALSLTIIVWYTRDAINDNRSSINLAYALGVISAGGGGVERNVSNSVRSHKGQCSPTACRLARCRQCQQKVPSIPLLIEMHKHTN